MVSAFFRVVSGPDHYPKTYAGNSRVNTTHVRKILYLFTIIILAGFTRYGLVPFLHSENIILQSIGIALILGIGIIFLLRASAKIIEETTEILSERTQIA